MHSRNENLVGDCSNCISELTWHSIQLQHRLMAVRQPESLTEINHIPIKLIFFNRNIFINIIED